MKQKQPFAPGAGKTDIFLWGACGALVGGTAGVIATAVDAMPATQSIGGLTAGGFFFAFAVASVKNWMAER